MMTPKRNSGASMDTRPVPNVRVRTHRKQRNLTQNELARLPGTTFIAVCRWDNGAVTPVLYFRKQLHELFGVGRQDLGLSLSLEKVAGNGEEISSSMSKSRWNVLSHRSPFFTDCEDLLTQLRFRPSTDKAPTSARLQALRGPGGIGKTQIAAKYAYRFRANYQAVLWARAETREDLIASFVSIAHLLNLSGEDVQDQSIPLAEIKRWLETQDSWLLILDNAQDYRTLYRTCRAALLKKRDGLVVDHPELVAATWPLSFEKTEQAKPAAVGPLQVCAFLSPDTIPEEIFTQGAAHFGSRLEPVQVEERVSIWREVGG